MSLPARLLNVFAVPGDVFEDVKNSRYTWTNWAVPVVVCIIVTVLSVLVMFAQPAIQQQIREQQVKAMDAQVEAGKMTREQADQALQVVDKFMGPTMLKAMGVIGAIVVTVLRLLWWGLILWALASIVFKLNPGFLKLLEVAGLALMIVALGQLVTLLLTVNLARMFATPSLGLLVENFDATRKSHLMLGAANVFSFWHVGVIASGFSRLLGVPFFRGALVVFAFWLIQEMLLILAGAGQMAL